MTDHTKKDYGEQTLFLSDDKIFYTLDGEGEYVGWPSVFMRLSMCNLTCKGFASKDAPYGCDSFVSWKIKNKLTFRELVAILETEGFQDHLHNGAIWKITGGEPLIQQSALLKLLVYIEARWGWVPKIDLETNATIMPDEYWIRVGATFTTSPKLSNNGDPEGKRYKPEVLRWHVCKGSGFKFVVNKQSDLDEVFEKYIGPFNIPRDRVWLMPCAGSRVEHIEAAQTIAELAKKYRLKFSPRLHLLLWDTALKA